MLWIFRKTGISDLGAERSSKMSATARSRTEYTYGYWLPARSEDRPKDEEMSKDEVQSFVRTSLGLLTAGCEQCVYSERLFCSKQNRPVKVHDSRCELFVRRPSALPQDLF